MQEVRAGERRAAALRMFQSGKYEEAARGFRQELDERETSEGWNDWAAAETFCGRIEAAIAGLHGRCEWIRRMCRPKRTCWHCVSNA